MSFESTVFGSDILYYLIVGSCSFFFAFVLAILTDYTDYTHIHISNRGGVDLVGPEMTSMMHLMALKSHVLIKRGSVASSVKR